MNGRKYNSETKAAVMAALLTGQSMSSVAAEYDIPEGTVKSWKARQNRHPVASVATTKKEEIGNLLVGYLEELLITLQVQVKVFRDEKWIKKQSASEVAVLHGVVADKGIRLLEALADKEPQSAQLPPAGDVSDAV